jgi:hypothetical protein
VGGIGCWVVYEIQIVLVGGGGVVTERKRYSQFETLKVELRKAYPASSLLRWLDLVLQAETNRLCASVWTASSAGHRVATSQVSAL